MTDDRGARVASARDDVDDAGWQACIADHFGELHCRQRRRLRRLQHHGVAAGERRRDLPGRHEQRKIPRDDLASHAEWPRVAAGKRVLEFVGPARVIEEMRGRQRYVDIARFADRLAAVERLDDGKLAGTLLQDPRDAVDVLAAIGRLHLRPGAVESLAGRLDGAVDIRFCRHRDAGKTLFGRRVDGLEITAFGRFDEIAADEQPVAVLDRHVVGAFRRRRILPAAMKRQF